MLQKSNILYSRQQNVFIPDEKRFCFRTFNNLLEWHESLTGTEGPHVLNVTWQNTIKINAWLKYCWNVFQLFDYSHWNNERKKENVVSHTHTAPVCTSGRVNNELYFLPVPWTSLLFLKSRCLATRETMRYICI